MYFAWSRILKSELGSYFVNGSFSERKSLRFKVTVVISMRPFGVVANEEGSVAAGALIPPY